MADSNILLPTHVREMGRYFLGTADKPCLKIDITLACFQQTGTTPSVIMLLKIADRGDASSHAKRLIKLRVGRQIEGRPSD